MAKYLVVLCTVLMSFNAAFAVSNFLVGDKNLRVVKESVDDYFDKLDKTVTSFSNTSQVFTDFILNCSNDSEEPDKIYVKAVTLAESLVSFPEEISTEKKRLFDEFHNIIQNRIDDMETTTVKFEKLCFDIIELILKIANKVTIMKFYKDKVGVYCQDSISSTQEDEDNLHLAEKGVQDVLDELNKMMIKLDASAPAFTTFIQNCQFRNDTNESEQLYAGAMTLSESFISFSNEIINGDQTLVDEFVRIAENSKEDDTEATTMRFEKISLDALKLFLKIANKLTLIEYYQSEANNYCQANTEE